MPLMSGGLRTGGPMAVTVAQERDVPQGFVAFKVMVYVPGDVNFSVVSNLVLELAPPVNNAPEGETVQVYEFPVPVERFLRSKVNGTQLKAGVKSVGLLQFCGLVFGSVAGL